MSEALRSRTPEQLEPDEAVLRSFGYFARVTAEELAAAQSALNLAVQRAPGHADAWAMLALLCVQDYAQGFSVHADALAIGADAARRAVEAGPSAHLAYFSLAQALFFQKERQSFRMAAERALTLNPMDGNSVAFLGELLTYAGDRERGLALSAPGSASTRRRRARPIHSGRGTPTTGVPRLWRVSFTRASREADADGAVGPGGDLLRPVQGAGCETPMYR
jgi:hypothetical protein